MKRSVFAFDAIAIFAWGSVLVAMATQFGYEYVHGVMASFSAMNRVMVVNSAEVALFASAFPLIGTALSSTHAFAIRNRTEIGLVDLIAAMLLCFSGAAFSIFLLANASCVFC